MGGLGGQFHCLGKIPNNSGWPPKFTKDLLSDFEMGKMEKSVKRDSVRGNQTDCQYMTISSICVTEV